MKNLKYVSLALMLFVGLGSIQAQQKELTKKDQIAKNQTFKKTDRKKKMQKELNMTPEQTKQIEDIRAKRADEKTRLRSIHPTNPILTCKESHHSFAQI